MRSQRRLVSPLSAVNLQPNTFIGGVSSVINSAAEFASRAGVLESDISSFEIVGNNIQLRVEINYNKLSFDNVNGLLFPNIVTYFTDLDNHCTTLSIQMFRRQTNMSMGLELAGNIIAWAHQPFIESSIKVLKLANFDKIATGYNGLAGISRLAWLPKFLGNTNPYGTFYWNCEKIFIPKATTLGNTSGYDGHFNNSPSGVEIWANPSLATSNGGAEDAELAWVRANKSAIIHYDLIGSENLLTTQNPITNLSIGTKYATALQLNFIPPSSVNGIDSYECYVNGIYKHNISASGESITGLEPNTPYNVTVKAVDIYHNKSVFSNLVNDTTSATYVIPVADIVSYYKLEGNALDFNNVNNGTPTAITYEAGLVGQRAILNGSTSRIILTNNASLQLTQGSIVTIINSTNAGSGYRGIVVKKQAYGLFLASGVLVAYSWGSATGIAVGEKSTGINLNDGLNHVIALTFNSGVVNGTKIYLDGNLVFTTSIAVSNQTKSLVIGAGTPDSIIQQINAKIDDSAVFNSILTAAEVLEITSKLQSGQSLI